MRTEDVKDAPIQAVVMFKKADVHGIVEFGFISKLYR